MNEHRATIVEGSIEDLGPNGIAFSVICCGDPKTIQRHTIAAAHTLTADELEQVIVRRYLMPHEQAHRASSAHCDHVEKLSARFSATPEGPDVTECDNCK